MEDIKRFIAQEITTHFSSTSTSEKMATVSSNMPSKSIMPSPTKNPIQVTNPSPNIIGEETNIIGEETNKLTLN